VFHDKLPKLLVSHAAELEEHSTIASSCQARFRRDRCAGFLGSHLTDRLLGRSHRVIAIDNWSLECANIGHLAGNENYRFVRHTFPILSSCPNKRSIRLSFCLSRRPIDYLELPIPTLKVGALGTHNTLGWPG